jgi:hypothetical protein
MLDLPNTGENVKNWVFSSALGFYCAVSMATASLAGTVVVPATSDIFSSGQAVADAGRGGTLPIEIDLAPGTNRSIQFSATGSVMAGPDFWPLVGPDGGTDNSLGPRPTGISSASGISGMQDPNFEFLAGVFLDGNTPVTGTEPAILNFNTIGTNFSSLSPLLQQSFAIGDGLTGTGTGQVQTFYIPDSATRLYLGFLDAYDFNGTPGQYADDTGSFTVQYSVVPEPASISIVVCGGIALLARRRRPSSRPS